MKWLDGLDINAEETIAKWLYRRYGTPPKRPWKLLGGLERHRWLNDARGIIDALEKDYEGRD